MKRKVERIDVFVPITRVFEENGAAIVEGYAFVNEVVPGEGGLRLKRSAMVAATPDFLKYGTGALRVMHGPVAAGTVPTVTWDDHGAFIRAEVVDANEKVKTLAGVYKGFSVGVSQLVMRGLDVEGCSWPEISLVDRPKDPDATCSVVRADIGDATSIEIEVDDVEDGTSTVVSISLADAGPQDFATAMNIDNATDAVYDEGWDASYTLWEVLYNIAASGAANAEELARRSIQQFADYIAPMVAGNTMPAKAERVALPAKWSPESVQLFRASLTKVLEVGGGRPFTLDGLERVEAQSPVVVSPVEEAPAAVTDPVPSEAIVRIESTLTNLTNKISRLDEIPAALARVDTFISTVEGISTSVQRFESRIAALEQAPVTLTAPIRFSQDARPVDRSFAANATSDQSAVNRAEIQAAITRLETDLPGETDEKKRMQGAAALNQLKVQLSQINN